MQHRQIRHSWGQASPWTDYLNLISSKHSTSLKWNRCNQHWWKVECMAHFNLCRNTPRHHLFFCPIMFINYNVSSNLYIKEKLFQSSQCYSHRKHKATIFVILKLKGKKKRKKGKIKQQTMRQLLVIKTTISHFFRKTDICCGRKWLNELQV